ncbi:MAG TPA: hypothetical protein VNQ76_06285 [Planctomicrobium sp.]|nr:hypothetical protein [Planctomicrobium sp.]
MINLLHRCLLSRIGFFLIAVFFTGWCEDHPIQAAQLYVGGATVNITPDEPVAMEGSFRLRIAKSVATPCIATALAIERRDGDISLEQAIFVSCDLVAIRGGAAPDADLYAPLRAALKGRIPDNVINKIILNATHTHTGPLLSEGKFHLPETGVMRAADYFEFLMTQLSAVIVQAWDAREPASVGWGLGHAVIAQNRRTVYADGTAVMYGKTDSPTFRGLEGGEDHGVEILYFWNDRGEPLATAINVACPAQAVEGGNAINADFWHPVRVMLQEKYGKRLLVLGWIGASGDQSPRPLYRYNAEERMRKLRGLNPAQSAAKKIVSTWEDVYEVVRRDQHADVALEHRVETVKLPYNRVTPADAKRAQQAIDRNDQAKGLFNRWWYQSVVSRYEQQQQSETLSYEMELHAIRLGDVAIVTNDFELFTDYGVQIKACSPALQTFVIQLCGPATYLPTERAVKGGGYSAIAESNLIGPKGGQVLVNEAVRLVKEIWESPKQDQTREKSQTSSEVSQ